MKNLPITPIIPIVDADWIPTMQGCLLCIRLIGQGITNPIDELNKLLNIFPPTLDLMKRKAPSTTMRDVVPIVDHTINSVPNLASGHRLQLFPKVNIETF